MPQRQLDVVFLGLSITSAWGNGHATTYRGLLKEIARRGHRVTFLERDMPWYASNREFTELPYCAIGLYHSLEELKDRFAAAVGTADVVIVGSYVPDGVAVGHWVTSHARHATVFYDIDTPVTLAQVAGGRCDYMSAELYPKYDLYLSFTGGPTLRLIEQTLGSPRARALYCSVDPTLYYPEPKAQRWDVAYLGTYAPDRQASLERLLLDVARANKEKHFAVAGPQYRAAIEWPSNVERIEHVPASEHRAFYNAQRFALNLTRRDMIEAGYSPSVRLFEAAACGVPIITDVWPGLETIFSLGSEILPANEGADVTFYLKRPVEEVLEIAERARRRTFRYHTAAMRAEEFESYALEALEGRSGLKKRGTALTYVAQ